MADNAPAAEDVKAPAVSAPKADVQPDVAQESKVSYQDIVPRFAKSLETLEKEKQASEQLEEAEEVQEEAVAPVPEEEDATLKKRFRGALSEVEKRNEEARRFVELQADQVRENNELIHKVAASDPVLANKVILKVWGTQGIRSYKQLVERTKLEGLRDTNPDAYETNLKLMEVEARLANAEQKEQKMVRNKFFNEKGILENEYDPNYLRLMEALDMINPAVVSEDYDKALNSAYSIAFGSGKPAVRVQEVPRMQVGGGRKPAPLPAVGPQVDDETMWLANQLNKNYGYKIQL